MKGPQPGSKRVYVAIPPNWDELTEDEQLAWSTEICRHFRVQLGVPEDKE